MESCLLLEFHTILRNKAATSAPTSYSQPVEPPRKVQHQHQQRANSQLRKAMNLQQKFLTFFTKTHGFKTNHTKQDHQRMNVAPDQTIISGLQIFLDHRSVKERKIDK